MRETWNLAYGELLLRALLSTNSKSQHGLLLRPEFLVNLILVEGAGGFATGEKSVVSIMPNDLFVWAIKTNIKII